MTLNKTNIKRIAFFVEGQTEQIFLNRLCKEILGTNHTNILLKQFRGGVNTPKQEIVRNKSLSRKPHYEVLISDCGSDNRVKSEILDNIGNLRENGYSMIVGLRDLYPLPIDDLDKLEKGLKFLPNRFRVDADYFDIVIAVHEIEAWFMAEVNHFKKVDKRLASGRFIEQQLGFNPYMCDSQRREHPAKDLSDIYKLVGKSYAKRYWQVTKLVNRLDYNNIRNNLRHEIAPLDRLITVLENLKEKYIN